MSEEVRGENLGGNLGRNLGGTVRVLDASALLAWLQEEQGGQTVEGYLSGSLVSAVNFSEVLQKSVAAGVEIPGLAEDLVQLGLTPVDFGAEEALVAARMWPKMRALGLGIADRACLATAVVRRCPVLTADRPWNQIEWDGLSVEVIR